MNYIWRCLLLCTIILGTGSCEDEDDNDNVINGDTALEYLIGSPDHELLVEALQRTQLDFNLDQNSSVTLFAPTDQAIKNYLSANAYGSIEDIPLGLLRSILLYHQLADISTVDQLTSRYYKTKSQIDGSQLDLFINKNSDEVLLNDKSRIIEGDNKVSNGIIHTVDQVLKLPSIYDLIQSNPEFSNFTTSINAQGLNISLSDNNDLLAPFTVLVPTNLAYQAFIDRDDDDEFEDLQDIYDQDNYSNQLLYHIIANANLRSADFVDNSSISPLGSGEFTINTDSGVYITDGQGFISNIVASDITAFNGVIHTIDLLLSAP